MDLYQINGFEFSHRLYVGGIGSQAQRSVTAPTNSITLLNGTAPSGTLVNGIDIYSVAGECWIMDAGGTATQQTPHDRVTGEWIFHSKNTRTGKVLKIDVERLMRRLDKEFGGGFIKEFVED